MIKAQNNITGKTNATIIKELPPLENIEVTPSKETQNLKSQDFYGFNQVTVVGEENLEPNNIISSKSIYGVQGSFDCDIKINLKDRISGGSLYNLTLQQTVMKINTTNVDTSGITNFNYAFNRFSNLEEVILDMKDATTANNCFASCTKLKADKIKLLNTDKIEDVSYMFDGCTGLTETVEFDTSAVKNFGRMYQNCKNIVTFKKMDCSSAISGFPQIFYTNYDKIKNIEGFVNYGKAFTEKVEGYSGYTLDLTPPYNLTHDAIMNVINNLYDLNLTYDVANGGTLYRQKISLGTNHKNKVSAEEKQIAKDKGWIVVE